MTNNGEHAEGYNNININNGLNGIPYTYGTKVGTSATGSYCVYCGNYFSTTDFLILHQKSLCTVNPSSLKTMQGIGGIGMTDGVSDGKPKVKKYKTLFIITAPSGSGKSTIGRAVFGDKEVKSFTTRKPRENEVEGVDYHFLTEHEFDVICSGNGFAETTTYDENHYGITMDELQDKMTKNDCFVVVDYNGMKQLQEIYPDCVTIFIMTEFEDARKCMLDRGDSLANVKKRLKTFYREQGNSQYYDYIIQNPYGKLNSTVNIVRAIVDNNR